MSLTGALLLDLDSLAQASTASGDDDAGFASHAALAALCRSTVLFADRIVLTDTQVFDGAILLRAGVDGVLDWVGATRRTEVVHVKLRGASAFESLRRMRDNPDMRWQIADESGRISDELVQQQDHWACAIDGGLFGRSGWRTDFDFLSSLKQGLEQAFESKLHAGLTTLTSRSNAHAAIEALATSEVEGQTWRLTWDSVYMSVLARPHESRWVSLDEHLQVRASIGGGRSVENSLGVEAIPAAVTSRLGGLSPGEFGRLLDGVSNLRGGSSRRRWIDRFRLSLAVLELTRPARPVRDLLLTVSRLLAFAALVVVTLSDVGAVTFPTWVLILIGVFVIAMQAPWVEVGQLISLARRDARALLRLPLGSGAL